MPYINNIDCDEIRSGYLVTDSLKRCFNAMIELVMELDRICKKHDLRYFITAGTLLGAVRHRGFIPWDHDFDVDMLRPDYEKLMQVIEDELEEPFYIETPYNQKYMLYHSQLRHRNTVLTTYPPNITLGGLQLDIFPLDFCPYNDRAYPPELAKKYLAAYELIKCRDNVDHMYQQVKAGADSFLTADQYEWLRTHTRLERMRYYEDYMLENFAVGDTVGVTSWVLLDKESQQNTFPRSWYDHTVYLPFETVELPTFSHYMEYLDIAYPDWHQPKITKNTNSLTAGMSADISYLELVDLIEQ